MKRFFKVIKKVVLSLLIIIVAAVLGLTVWNQILSLREKESLEQLGQSIEVNGTSMRVYATGEGSQTIVMLSGQGTLSPIIDFKPLADSLGKYYRVIVLEYLGSGLSDDTNSKRTSDNIVEEIHGALQKLNIKGQYILMPHSISGIYTMRYLQIYPQEVEAIIGIEATMPNQAKYESEVLIPNNMRVLSDVCDVVGITRLELNISYAYLDDMYAGGYYTREEIRQVIAICSRRSISKAQLSENNLYHHNCEQLYNYKYPDTLPVLMILASDSCNDFNSYAKIKGYKESWSSLHEEAMSNTDIQSIVTLEGGHYLHWTQKDNLVQLITEFMKKYVTTKR